MTHEVGPSAPASATLPAFARILLVTDFSSCSEAAAPFARRLAELYGASLVVAHVVRADPEESGSADPDSAQVREEPDSAEVQMRKFLAENSLDDVPTETLIRHGVVADVAAALIQEKNIDLVVLGTHGRSGVGKLMLGSMAQRIFGIAPCPVLSVSPQARDAWSKGKFATILYATDFSTDSLKALPFALSLAKAGNAELILLQVPQDTSTDPHWEDRKHMWHKQLNDLVPLEARSWCRYDSIVISGDPAAVILDVAKERNVDLIVLGAHSIEGSLTAIRVPLSTPYQVVAHALCPVLRVRS